MGVRLFCKSIDDHYRKLWVYTLKIEDQVLAVFKLFQASIEKEMGKKLKCIYKDNGSESLGPFDPYCKVHGIKNLKSPIEFLIKWLS